MREALTRGIRIGVVCRFFPEHSFPEQGKFFFHYTVTIRNEGTEQVQLLSRHWEITDGNGNVKHVRGPGVVGVQPVLHGTQEFTYTSGCELETPSGKMSGEYSFVTESGETFDAAIPEFRLFRLQIVAQKEPVAATL